MDYPAPDPSTRADGPAPRRRLSRRAKGWIAASTAALVIAAAGVTTVTVRAELAAQSYARTVDRYELVVPDYIDILAQRRAAQAAAGATLDLAGTVTAMAEAGYVDAAALASFSAAIPPLEEIVAEPVSGTGPLPEPTAPADPEDTEERFAASAELNETLDDLAATAEELEESTASVRASIDGLTDARAALFDSAVAQGDAIAAANPAATKQSLFALDEYLHPGAWNPIRDGETLAAYIHLAKEVQASQAQALEEQSQPDWPAKAEVIAFANSIAGGTPLDVSWSETLTIDGELYGAGASGAGFATWRTDLDRLGTIELTDSIARYWGDAWTAGLVAHEVGHTITSKDGCLALYRAAPFVGDDEKWATAWALSLGYGEGSGTGPYGYPGDDAVAIAAQCR